MGAMKPYIVRQGDYVASIALAEGCGVDDIWSSAQNQTLKDEGRTTGVLCPGDLLRVPVRRPGGEMSLTLGGDNMFNATVTKSVVRIKVDPSVFDVRGQKFLVRSAGGENDGAADEAGCVQFAVRDVDREVEVCFPDVPLILRVFVGGMDPLNERSGLGTRLTNLGYLRHEDIAESTDALRGAVGRLRDAMDLDPDEESNDEFLKLLRSRAGC